MKHIYVFGIRRLSFRWLIIPYWNEITFHAESNVDILRDGDYLIDFNYSRPESCCMSLPFPVKISNREGCVVVTSQYLNATMNLENGTLIGTGESLVAYAKIKGSVVFKVTDGN